jgi:hypothetical protein
VAQASRFVAAVRADAAPCAAPENVRLLSAKSAVRSAKCPRAAIGWPCFFALHKDNEVLYLARALYR